MYLRKEWVAKEIFNAKSYQYVDLIVDVLQRRKHVTIKKQGPMCHFLLCFRTLPTSKDHHNLR